MAFKVAEYKTDLHIDWCPGCGDFGITSALQQALAELEIEPHNVVLFSGIGCSGKFPHYIRAYGVHTLHGRPLPFAIGCKLANPHLTVIAIGGDGDGLGIGVGHFVNAGRRNVDITYIVANNGVYGLTKGQASPTLALGLKTKSLPKPNINQGINPLLLAFASGYTFIARTYSYDVRHQVETFKKGILHRGLAFIDVLQGCPTYNDLWTKDWYMGRDHIDPETGKPVPRLYRLEDTGYDPRIPPEGLPREACEARVAQFVQKALEWGDRIPIGVFWKDESVSTYEDRIRATAPTYLDLPPALRPICDEDGRPLTDIRKFLDELRVTGP
jgi:2-oxoglutarate ferredoxin oxidoreductase subunit beta